MRLEHEIFVDAPADDAWQVLGQQFGAIAQWSATLRASSLVGPLGVGAVRTCEGVGFGPFPPGETTEALTRFDPEQRALSYEATSGLPWFVSSARNAWRVEALGPRRCCVRSRATIALAWWLRPLSWLLPWLLARDLARFSEELRHRIEHGEPHPRKVAASSTVRAPA